MNRVVVDNRPGAGVHMVHIPYAGGAPAQRALLSAQVDLTVDNLIPASANIKGVKLQAIAATTSQREGRLTRPQRQAPPKRALRRSRCAAARPVAT